MKPKISELFLISVKIGAILLGGGYVILPLLKNEFANKRNWLTDEEVIDFYALAQCLPGLIGLNVVAFAGYKMRGKLGALVCMLGLCLSPFLVIVAIAGFLGLFVKSALVESVFWGVNIGILLLVFLTVFEVWGKAIVDKTTFFIFLVMFLLCLAGISPVFIIILSILIGFLSVKFRK